MAGLLDPPRKPQGLFGNPEVGSVTDPALGPDPVRQIMPMIDYQNQGAGRGVRTVPKLLQSLTSRLQLRRSDYIMGPAQRKRRAYCNLVG